MACGRAGPAAGEVTVGPYASGHWTGSGALEACHDLLEAGERYRVRRAFTDFDGDEHRPGEEWTFLGCSFLPYEDGLSLFVSLDGRREWQIRMQWRPESQGTVLDALAKYVERA